MTREPVIRLVVEYKRSVTHFDSSGSTRDNAIIGSDLSK